MNPPNSNPRNDDHPGFVIDRNFSRLVLPLNTLEYLRAIELAEEIAIHEETVDPTVRFADDKVAVPVAVSASSSKRSVNQKWLRPLVDVAQVEEILKRVSKGFGGRSDRTDSIKKTCTDLLAKGVQRELTRPKRNWRQRLLEAGTNYPNGAVFFNFIAAQLLIAEHAGHPVVVPPLCLVGAPGVGKSTLVELVAEILNRPLHRIQVEIGGHASTLVGTEAHWSNSGPGSIFTALVTGSSISPILMLDELEKVQKRDDYPNLHKVLYSLLENASSKKFVDLSIPDLQIDASHVQWIGTANSLEGIPDAILSRMRVLEIPPLTQEQSTTVLMRVDSAIRKELKIQEWPPLDAKVVKLLCMESPRRMWQKIREAYGTTMLRGEQQVLESDVVPATDYKAPHEKRGPSELESLLTLTTLSSLRALELHSQLVLARRLWAGAEPGDTVH